MIGWGVCAKPIGGNQGTSQQTRNFTSQSRSSSSFDTFESYLSSPGIGPVSTLLLSTQPLSQSSLNISSRSATSYISLGTRGRAPLPTTRTPSTLQLRRQKHSPPNGPTPCRPQDAHLHRHPPRPLHSPLGAEAMEPGLRKVGEGFLWLETV